MARITVWRLVREKYAQTAFSGEGARLFGGRWNSKGNRVVYTADTPALCQLEILAHAGSYHQLENCLLFSAAIEERHVKTLTEEEIPDDWDARPPAQATKRIGDLWIVEVTSLALKVPSVLDPHGANILVNPAHPEFDTIECSEGTSYPIDERRTII